MIKTVATIFFLCIANVCFAADDSQEPPLKYTLEVNGKRHEVTLDKSIQLQGIYKNPKVVLRASPTRQFSFGHLEFQYPAWFTWEAEINGPNDKNWSLSGNDFKIMYFVQSQALTLETYVAAMAKQFGKEKTRISETERVLGGRKYKGRLIFVKLAGVALNLEVYTLPAKSGSRLLVFQDRPPDNRAVSKEGERVLDMLSRTFRDTSTSNPDPGNIK
jgi:hypothetical protein